VRRPPRLVGILGLLVLAVVMVAGRRRLVHVLTRLTGTWVGTPDA